MALNAIDYIIYKELAKAKQIPANPDVLELGEANWYGDVSIGELVEDIKAFTAPARGLELLKDLKQVMSSCIGGANNQVSFDISKIFYKTFLNYRSITAIDLGGTDNALQYDLNIPVPLETQYHIVINTGTAEHIFNLFQFFKTVHERTLPGGLMIHAMPFTGWLDHGFFNFNPTFTVDLAAANCYQLLMWIYGEVKPLRIVQLKSIEQVHTMAQHNELGSNSLQYLVMQKPREETPFTAPMQGVYARKVSDQTKQDWVQMR
jgi:hypothetical protein